jgi:hypothetical protein
MMVDREVVIYRLNDVDEIVFVNHEWDQFAAANAGERASSGCVLHRPLWDFIVDQTTQQLYRDVLKRIREGRSLRFRFRCDSPTCRRFMEMDVAPSECGGVEFRTRTLSVERRPAQALLETRRVPTEELLRACAWCKRIDVGGMWAEVEEAVARLRLFERDRLPMVTHGICQACYEEMARTLVAG